VQKPDCPPILNPIDGTMEQIGISINRGGGMPPPATTARVACATIAHSN
jgi:hypothetical protein